MALFAFAVTGAVTILAVALIVLALVFYLVSIILNLRKITAGLAEVMNGVDGMVQKSAPVNGVVKTINEQLDTGVDLLEGLLVKKAGLEDAVGLVDGLYPGSAAAGFRKFPASRTIKPSRIDEVYEKGTLTLARLGREAPIAAASPAGRTGATIQYGPSPPDTISWGRAAHESLAGAAEPQAAASEPQPGPPEPPETISWKRD